MNKFKVFSMFDGVGGFVLGLDNANKYLGENIYETIYTNQFEPSRKSQDAFEVGVYNYPNISHSNDDITKVSDSYFKEMKKNGVNLIVGGFPCQDYSVARSKKDESGIEGKKGVLFWEIIRAVKFINPEYLILENVDRLLKSPSKQRGRDFAIMLGAFNQLGYSVEWRVINAADYGSSQRRRRVFFFIYRNDTEFVKSIDKNFSITSGSNSKLCSKYIFELGLFARQFPVEMEAYKNREYLGILSLLEPESGDYILDISNNFTGSIWNTGIMINGEYFTVDTKSEKKESKTLGEVIEEAKEYYIKNFGESVYNNYIDSFVIRDQSKIEKFKYLRGSKKIERVTPDGHKWIYSEGGMSEVDEINLPARTMLTSEGSVNRSTHLLRYKDTFRLITPIEAELLQEFPPDWTKYKKLKNGNIEEVSDRMRMFFMGNALVTGIVKNIGIGIVNILE